MPLILTPGQLIHRGELYHQLGHLITSGIGLIQALEIQYRNPPTKSLREPLGTILALLKEGETFGEALRQLPQWFPAFDAALLQAAEKSGRLPSSFSMLAEHYRERANLGRQLITYCAYPVLLLHMAILIFPISRLQGLVLQGDILGFVGQKLTVLGPLYVLVFLALVATQGTRGRGWRSVTERLQRGVPALGTARHSLALARLCAALEALISAGTTIIESWEMAAAASGSPALERAVAQFKPRWENGETPAESLSRSREFPDMFSNQYASGEISGRLDETLRWLGAHYREEGARKLRNVIVSVAGMVFFGVVLLVAWQVISFWIAYFNQIQQAIPQ